MNPVINKEPGEQPGDDLFSSVACPPSLTDEGQVRSGRSERLFNSRRVHVASLLG
jgi:hypothetical protein